MHLIFDSKTHMLTFCFLILWTSNVNWYYCVKYVIFFAIFGSFVFHTAVATGLRFYGEYNKILAANLSQSLSVKEFFKSVSIGQSYASEYSCVYFDSRCTNRTKIWIPKIRSRLFKNFLAKFGYFIPNSSGVLLPKLRVYFFCGTRRILY